MQTKNTIYENQVSKNMEFTPQELTSWICPVDERVNPGSVDVCPLCGRRREKEYSNPEKPSQPAEGWKCPVCETVNSSELAKCRVCGTGNPTIEPSPNRYKRKVWKCPVCSNQNRIELDVCEKCKTPYSWKCEYCQYLNKNKASHCVNCGKSRTPPKNNKIAWIVAAIIAIIIIIAASSSGNQTNSTQNKTQLRVTPTPTAYSSQADAFKKGKEKTGATPAPTPTASQKAGPKQLDGTWREQEAIHNGKSSPFYLSKNINNCKSLTMSLTISEYTGYPFGNWYLYAKDLSDHWTQIGNFRIEKTQGSGGTYEYEFRFDTPQSFKALAICIRDDGNEFNLSYNIEFYS